MVNVSISNDIIAFISINIIGRDGERWREVESVESHNH